MKNRYTDAFDNNEKPVEIKEALDQGAAGGAWKKLTAYRKTFDQMIQGAHNRFYCVKNHEEISVPHYTIEVLPPGSDPDRLDARLSFTLIKSGSGKFKVRPNADLLNGEEFEINARDANNMLAEIAAGTREVKKETVVDGIKARTRRKLAKI